MCCLLLILGFVNCFKNGFVWEVCVLNVLILSFLKFVILFWILGFLRVLVVLLLNVIKVKWGCFFLGMCLIVWIIVFVVVLWLGCIVYLG